MAQNTNLETASPETERLPERAKETEPGLEAIAAAAADLGRRIVWLPGAHSSRFFLERYRTLCQALKPVLSSFQGPLPKKPVGDDFHWLYDNLHLLYSDLYGTKTGFKLVRKLPHVRTPEGTITPRVVALVGGYLAATGYEFAEASLSSFVQSFQQSTALKLVELWALCSESSRH